MMEFKNLTAQQKIPVLGIGTWKIGGGMIADRSHDQKYIEAIQFAISSRITHIDTAEIYGAGHAEELVGIAIKNFDRKRLFITTKVSPHHLSFDQILAACDRSLQRLQTDYIDLYLIHWPNPLASVKKAMAAFDHLVNRGLVHFIGVSNFSVKQFKNAQAYSANEIVTNQIEYSLLEKAPEKEFLEFCQQENVVLTAYSPLAQGKLTQPGFKALDYIAEKYKKTQTQVALRWLIEKPNVITIPKASSKDHIQELLGCLGWKLAIDDQEYLAHNF